MYNGKARLAIGMLIVALGVLAAYFANQILPQLDLTQGRWTPMYQFPSRHPIGIDFREGLYYPAKVLLEGKSPYVFYSSNYAPLAILLGIPFRVLDPDRAYLAQVGLLYALNVLSLWLAVKIAAKCFRGEDSAEWAVPMGRIADGAFAAIAFLTLTSYGFLFSIERGNFDIYPQSAALLGLWWMVSAPKRLWLQVACIAVAAHLKLYPAVLFVLIIWQHGWKSLFPLVVVNLVLLLCTGPANAVQFVEVMIRYAQAPYIWVGNHSAASFGQMLTEYLNSRAWVAPPTWLFYLLPAVVWGAGLVRLWTRKRADSLAWMYVLSVPVMNLIPSTSHDYKLVLLSAPAVMIILWLVTDFSRHGHWVRLLQLASIMAILVFATRSYTQLPVVLRNKYPIVLALQVASLWILLSATSPRPEARAGAGSRSDRYPPEPSSANGLRLETALDEGTQLRGPVVVSKGLLR